jgi:hypothetical protein
MHRRLTQELCISQNGNLKSPAFMRYFAVSLRKLLLMSEKNVGHWLCKLRVIRMNPALVDSRGRLSLRRRGSGSHPDTYVGKLLSLQFHCEKECVLCRSMILLRAAAG